MSYNAADIAELAQAYDMGDPIDWGMLDISEAEMYQLMAEQVIEIVRGSENAELVAVAAMTKLLVENFVLNLQLAGIEHFE